MVAMAREAVHRARWTRGDVEVKTYSPKASEIQRDWYVVDAAGKNLGRLASKIAIILHGKHKPTYTPHMDMGDYVIVLNAEKIQVTGRKLDQKFYYRLSMYHGGLKQISLRNQISHHPDRVIELAAARAVLSRRRALISGASSLRAASLTSSRLSMACQAGSLSGSQHDIGLGTRPIDG